MWLLLAVFLLSCSQLASQIYIPVLPSIGQDLTLSTAGSQALISSYFITLGLSQLITGPCRDNFGDKPIFVVGQAVLIGGTILCTIAPDPNWFLLGRVLQGIGAASPLLISRTLLASKLGGSELKSAMATLAMASSITSIVTPLISGVLSEWFTWRGMSTVLVAYYAAVTFCGLKLLSTQPQTETSMHPKFLIKQYRDLLKQGPFLYVACIKWVPTFLYLTIQLYLPFLLSHDFNYSDKDVGQAMMIPMVGLLIGTIFAKVLQKRFCYLKLVVCFWPLLIVGAGLFAFSVVPLGYLLAYAIIMMVFGIYFPSYMHLIGIVEPQKSGTANALVGAIELLVFTLLALAMNYWMLHSVVAVAVFICCCALVVLHAWYHLNKRNIMQPAHMIEEIK
jgi:DHA1 family 2-module integral membrane pump EmrD-like MFS transporter